MVARCLWLLTDARTLLLVLLLYCVVERRVLLLQCECDELWLFAPFGYPYSTPVLRSVQYGCMYSRPPNVGSLRVLLTPRCVQYAVYRMYQVLGSSNKKSASTHFLSVLILSSLYRNSCFGTKCLLYLVIVEGNSSQNQSSSSIITGHISYNDIYTKTLINRNNER
jgi:hypothetical protein